MDKTLETRMPATSALMDKTILILSNNDGGLWGFRRELMEELVKRRNRVIASIPGDEPKYVDKIEKLGVEVEPTKVDRRGMSPKNDLKLLKAYRKLLKRIKPDLVITYTIKPNVYGGRACQEACVPYVCNVSGLGTAFQNEGGLKRLATKMYRAGTKKARVVFFENEANRDTMVELRIVEKERTFVLPGAGVNTEYFSYAPYPADEATIRFLFLGRIMKEKGVDELLNAVRSLHAEGQSVHLDICGMLEEKGYKELLEKAESEGWLTNHGIVNDVRPYIMNCHCFILPSWHEGMANANLEAASMGRPVITSNIPGCREAVEDGVSGLLCAAKDSSGLSAALKTFLLMANDDRAAMGNFGRVRMCDKFSKSRVVSETQRVIESVLLDNM